MSIIRNILKSKSNERLRQLIEAIRTRDFSLQYSLNHLKGEERKLAQQINEVVNEFRETTLRQEAKYQYFGTMLDTINAFLIVADEKGAVHWMNRAAVDGLCGFAVNRLQDLHVVDEALPDAMQTLKPKDQRLVQLAVNNGQDEEKADFMLSVVNFFNKGFAYRLYTLQNVQPVIQKNEIDAQQQLVSVLTHEIMNSLTPIISLADTLCDGVEQNTLEYDDLRMALQAINRRSSGLLQFVENYRKLQHVSQPQLENVMIGDMIADLQHLYPAPVFRYDIENPEQMLRVDRSQIEQVLINLMENVVLHAKGATAIVLRVTREEDETVFAVEDDGCGIDKNILPKLFKETFPHAGEMSGDGRRSMGIGLSACTSVVQAHGGSMFAENLSQGGARIGFTLPIDTKTKREDI